MDYPKYQTSTCQHCGKEFTHRRTPAKFCSKKCNQHSKASGIKPYITKAKQSFTITCQHCGNEFTINGNQRKRKYCNDSCKQLAYRKRKAAKKQTTT